MASADADVATINRELTEEERGLAQEARDEAQKARDDAAVSAENAEHAAEKAVLESKWPDQTKALSRKKSEYVIEVQDTQSTYAVNVSSINAQVEAAEQALFKDYELKKQNLFKDHELKKQNLLEEAKVELQSAENQRNQRIKQRDVKFALECKSTLDDIATSECRAKELGLKLEPPIDPVFIQWAKKIAGSGGAEEHDQPDKP